MKQASCGVGVALRVVGILALFTLDVRAAVSVQTSSQSTPAAAPAPTTPVDALRSENPALRRKAAEALGKSRSPEALPRLAELVRDPDLNVRLAVLRSISSLRDVLGVPSMVVFMNDAEPRVRLESIDGVVEIYTHRDRPRSSKFLAIFSDGRDKPEPLLVAAVDFEVYRSLAARLKDADAEVREHAAEAIGILGGTEVAVDLVAALRDPASTVRLAAVSALVKVGTSADGEALAPLLRDNAGPVRRRVIAGLGRLKVVDAAPDLRALFERSPDSEEGSLGLNSLAQLALIQDRSLFQRLAFLADPKRRRPAIEALARLGDKEHESRFKRGFQREKNEELRAAYAFAILLFGDRPFIDTVILGLSESRDRARQSRGYLEELGARALPEALDYLRETDPQIRAGLCAALGNAGVTDALAAMEPLTKDRDPQVAASAMRAVAILGRQKP